MLQKSASEAESVSFRTPLTPPEPPVPEPPVPEPPVPPVLAPAEPPTPSTPLQT